jgi:hypothetical protein
MAQKTTSAKTGHHSAADEKIRTILNDAMKDPEVFRMLRSDPAAIAKKYDLSADERERLLRSDLLLLNVDNPITHDAIARVQTTKCITIVARSRSADGDPGKLQDLSKEELVELTKHVLTDQDYAHQVRTFVAASSDVK